MNHPSNAAALGNSTVPDSPHLVTMPLVRLLAEHELSWSQRMEVAHALARTLHHYKSMQDEARAHQAAGQAQQAKLPQINPELLKQLGVRDLS